MPLTLSGNQTKFLRDYLKENARVQPFNPTGPDWSYILDPSQPDPLARLRKFLDQPKAYPSVSGRWDSKYRRYAGLHVAVKVKNHAALRLLLEKGAWIEGRANSELYEEHDAPLHVAAKDGNIEAADIL